MRKAWWTTYYSAITCVFRKFTTRFLLEAISCYIKDKMLTGNQKNGLSRDKLCLTNLTSFYTEMTDWLCGGEGNASLLLFILVLPKPSTQSSTDSVSQFMEIFKTWSHAAWTTALALLWAACQTQWLSSMFFPTKLPHDSMVCLIINVHTRNVSNKTESSHLKNSWTFIC